jgi:hypothetical protein
MSEFLLDVIWIKPLVPCGGESGKEPTHLIGTLRMGDADHHIEAFEVHDVNGCQEPVEEGTSFDELSEIAQGAMQTVMLGGREYAILVTPFQY